jgi:hypothetical protein
MNTPHDDRTAEAAMALYLYYCSECNYAASTVCSCFDKRDCDAQVYSEEMAKKFYEYFEQYWLRVRAQQ